jgi:hypothetical protein
MQPIQAIICFNGGSAGDLVKKLALLCYDIDVGNIQDLGITVLPQQFKNFFSNCQTHNLDINNLNWEKVFPIENSHYYFDCFEKISKRLFFIDYNDSINSTILSEYIRKRNNGDIEHFLRQHIHSLPVELQHKVNPSNCLKAFEILWLKNIHQWRSNAKLIPINFYDILQRNTALAVAETVAGSKVKDIKKFDSIYNQWIERNSVFAELSKSQR